MKRNTQLPGYYSKHLGPKLAELIKEHLDKPHDEQVALYEELAIARATACQALQLASPLFEDSGKTLEPELKSLMMSTLNEAMKSVKDLVLAAGKLEKDSKDSVSIKTLNLVVMQIITAVHDVCGTENLGIAEMIADRINERVRLPLNDKLNPHITVQISDGNNS